MDRTMTRAAALALVVFFGRPAANLGADPGADSKGEKRAALRQALDKAVPTELKPIEVQAENPSLTQVVFWSKGGIYVFDAKTAEVSRRSYMKAVIHVDRITFKESAKGICLWELWIGEEVTLRFPADK